MKSNQYLSCPFCVANPLDFEPEVEGSDGDYKATCGYCGATAPRADTIEDAINNWNDRPEPHENQYYIQGFNDAKKQIIDMAKFIGMKDE